jgi:uncharacterized membrane protein YqaE (UPF0057 family)
MARLFHGVRRASAAILKIAIQHRHHAATRNTLKGSPTMRLLIALLLPWLTFFTIGRPFAGIICLILQITLIGWIPATIWAVYALGQYKTDEKIRDAMGRR